MNIKEIEKNYPKAYNKLSIWAKKENIKLDEAIPMSKLYHFFAENDMIVDLFTLGLKLMSNKLNKEDYITIAPLNEERYNLAQKALKKLIEKYRIQGEIKEIRELNLFNRKYFSK